MHLQRLWQLAASSASLAAIAACSAPAVTSSIPQSQAYSQPATRSSTKAVAALYTINVNDTISAFSIDTASGQPTAIAGSPFASGTDGASWFNLAYDPAGPTLFATGANTVNGGNVAVFSVQKTGALTMLSNDTAAATAHQPVLSPNGSYLYVLSGNAEIFGFKVVKHRTLKAIAGSPYPVTCPGLFCGPNPIAATIRGKTLYMVDTWGWVVSTFGIGKGGALTQTASVATDASPIDLALAPDGGHLFVSDQHNSVTSSYTVHGATVVPVKGSPFKNDGGPAGVAMTPDGKYLYSAGQSDSTISAFSIKGGKPKTVSGSPFADANGGPVALAIDSSGKYLFAANAASVTVAIYAIDSSTGKLAPIAGSPFALNSAGAPLGLVVTF
jgi:6-phosphogluconolactonase